MCLQGLAATLFGLERARAILEWEAMQTALLRAGAVVALATGGFVAFAVTKPSSAWMPRTLLSPSELQKWETADTEAERPACMRSRS